MNQTRNNQARLTSVSEPGGPKIVCVLPEPVCPRKQRARVALAQLLQQRRCNRLLIADCQCSTADDSRCRCPGDRGGRRRLRRRRLPCVEAATK
eukprot:scaffold46079_cov75-Phaeocystis_antarctica.AAC.3